MEKLYLTRIQDEIEDNAYVHPQPLELVNSEDNEHPFFALDSERAQWHYYKLSQKGKFLSYQYVNMTKHRLIRLMSRGVFDAQLARELKITPEDIRFYHSKMYHLNEYFQGLETEWKKGIVARGKIEQLAEEKATQEYYANYNKDMGDELSIRALLAQNTFYRNNAPTRSFVEGRLQKYTAQIIEKHEGKHLLAEEHNNGDHSLAAYSKKDKRLMLDIRVLLNKKKQAYKDMFKNAASNTRITYARAVPPENQQHITPPILVITSWRHGMDLLANYRDWYNDLHADAIAAARELKSRKVDKTLYDAKVDVVERRFSKKENQRRFAQLISEGCSQAEAGRQVGITSSTANRWANNPDICQIIPNN